MAHSTLLNNLLAYWPMSEAAGATRVDSTGNYDLTDTGTVGQGRFNPVFNAGFQLTGCAVITNPSVQWLARPNGTDLASNGSNMSFCGWVRLDAYPGIQAIICGKFANESLGEDYGLFFTPTTFAAGFGFYAQVGTALGIGQSVYVAVAPGTTTPTLGQWYFVLARWKNGSVLECRVNNGDWGSVSAPIPLSGTTVSRFSVGGRVLSNGTNNGGPTFALTGAVCNVGVWNRLLNDAECGELWQGGFGRTYDFRYPDLTHT